MVREGWALSDKVQIHYLDSDPAQRAGGLPLLLIPGMLGAAEDYLSDMESLAPRRCVSASLRGRGKSDAPKQGYSFEDHVDDVQAVVHAAGLSGFCALGYSTGVAYALGYAVRHPSALQGLVLLDYPARYPAIGPEWVDRALPFLSDPAREPVVGALQRESVEVPLWESLERIECPVLILRGGKAGSMLSEEDARRYRRRLRRARIVVFEDSGHELWDPDRDRYLHELRAFLQEIDAR